MTNKSCGVSICLDRTVFPRGSIRNVFSPPKGISGRGGAIRIKGPKRDMLVIGTYLPPNSANNNKIKASSVEIDETLATNTISLNDINYIASNLNPNSTHLDVLLTFASCPDAVKYGLKQYEATQKIRKDRIARDKEEELKNSKKSSKAASNSNMFDLDDDGWADDDDEEMPKNNDKKDDGYFKKLKNWWNDDDEEQSSPKDSSKEQNVALPTALKLNRCVFHERLRRPN